MARGSGGAPAGWACLTAGVLAVVFAVLVIQRVPTAAYLDAAAALAGLVLGVVSLVRRERPVAPALIGLAISGLLAALMLYAIFGYNA